MTENLKKLSLILLGLFFIGGLANFGRVFLISIAGKKFCLKICLFIYMGNLDILDTIFF